jgi:hypothetical protein
MQRSLLIFLFLALPAFGQDFGEIFAKIFQEQAEHNLQVLTVDAGSSRRVSLPLRPSTMGSSDIILVGTRDVGPANPPVRVALRLPSGATIEPNNANGAGFRWEKDSTMQGMRLSACNAAKSWDLITLPGNLPVGEYVVEAAAPPQAPSSILCVTFVSLGLGREGEDYEVVGSSVKTGQKIYQLGDPVKISVPVLENGRPVRNAKVEAVVSLRENGIVSGEVARLALTDAAGNGSYGGVFQPNKPADYYVTVTISGRKQRETGSFEVVPLQARLLSASLRSAGRNLQAQMRFQIFSAGQYTVTPTLRGGNGKGDNSMIRVDLTPGEHVVTWNISAEELQVLEVAAPYQLIEVHVIKTNPNAEFGADFVGWWLNQAGQWKPK